MTDNSTQAGADTIRDKDRAGVKTQIFGLDVGIGTGTEALMSATNPAPVYDPDQTTTGTVAMSATTNAVTATLAGDSTVGFAISGTWTGTLVFEATINGTDWFAVNAGANATGALATSTTANTQGQSLAAGCEGFRIRCSVTGTGTASVTLIAAGSSGLAKMVTPLPAGTNTIGNVGQVAAPTATLTSVAGTTTSTTILAANTSRRGAALHATTGSASVYVRLGGGTATSALGGHSFDLSAGSYYEVPNGFTGAITAVWASATGGLNVTELT